MTQPIACVQDPQLCVIDLMPENYVVGRKDFARRDQPSDKLAIYRCSRCDPPVRTAGKPIIHAEKQR